MSNSLGRKLRAAMMGQQQIITPRLNMFLMKNPNLVLRDDVAERIMELLLAKPRVRSGSFSSSSAGVCLRRQVYDYLGIGGTPVNAPQLQQIFYDGTWRHLRWQAVLLQAGLLTDIEFPLTWPHKRSVGTMDGLGQVPDDHPNEMWRGMEFGFELKGINTYGFRTAQASGVKEEHLDQIHRYFLSGGFDLFVVIYEDKNTQEWLEWVIEPDPVRMDAQRRELESLNAYVDKKLIPVMLDGCRNQTGRDWDYCPYAGNDGLCERTDEWK